MQPNPIYVIEDDLDDVHSLRDVRKEIDLKRPILYFSRAQTFLEHLETVEVMPFLILCDINLPKENGFELRRRLQRHPTIRYKSIPFVFWSTSASEKDVQQAYDLSAQGFFVKPSDFRTLCRVFKALIDYWEISKHPREVS